MLLMGLFTFCFVGWEGGEAAPTPKLGLGWHRLLLLFPIRLPPPVSVPTFVPTHTSERSVPTAIPISMPTPSARMVFDLELAKQESVANPL